MSHLFTVFIKKCNLIKEHFSYLLIQQLRDAQKDTMSIHAGVKYFIETGNIMAAVQLMLYSLIQCDKGSATGDEAISGSTKELHAYQSDQQIVIT